MNEWADMLMHLETFSELNESNWDGYGAHPITPEVVDRAREFLKAAQQAGILVPCDVTPTNQGEINIAWETSEIIEEAFYAEIEVAPDSYTGYIETDQGPIFLGSRKLDEAVEALKRVLEMWER